MAPLSLQQKSFVFSMISNAAANMAGASVPDLEAAVANRFNTVTAQNTQYLGTGWQLVWGPVVHEEARSGVADNTVMVVRGTDGGSPVYIVAIAGTNAVSAFDIYTEDLEVHERVAFGATGAKISKGTNVGIKIIESLTSSGATLQQYLAGVAAKSATLVFTGHSLGGALCPTLALDLAVNLGFDLTRWAAVYVYPTAGPTPGDGRFVTLFKKTFPTSGKGPTGTWNQNIVNSLDVVPRAWNHLSTIRPIYKPALDGSVCIRLLVEGLRSHRGLINYYDNLPNTQFPGTFNRAAPAPTHSDDASVRFAAQAFYQHIPAYTIALVPEFSAVFTGGSLPESATDAIYNKCHGLGA